MKSLGPSARALWSAIASTGRDCGLDDLQSDEIRRLVATARIPLSQMLSTLVQQGYLSCDYTAEYINRRWWFGSNCKAPRGGESVVRAQPPEHVQAAMAKGRTAVHHASGPAEADQPLVLRPGADDHQDIPSRSGSRLFFRDGRVTDLAGNPIEGVSA